MNTIAFEVKTDVSHPPETFLVPQLMIDEKVFTDFSTYALDLKALTSSITNEGEHFILSCWCGDPGCTGIENGIKVSHTSNTISWNISAPFEERVLEFSKHNYLSAIENLIAEVPLICAKLTAEGIKADIVPYGCESFLEPITGDA